MTKDKFNEKKKVFIMRLFIVFFIVVSAVIAYLKDTFGFAFIARMMGVSWGALAGAFLAPFLYGLYRKRTTVPAVTVCYIRGVVFTVIMFLKSMGLIALSTTGFIGLMFKTCLRCGVFTMVTGLVLVPPVSLIAKSLTRRQSERC